MWNVQNCKLTIWVPKLKFYFASLFQSESLNNATKVNLSCQLNLNTQNGRSALQGQDSRFKL